MDSDSRDDLGTWVGMSWLLKGISSVGVKTTALKQPAEAFAKNADIAILLTWFPNRMYDAGQMHQVAKIAARIEVLGDPDFEIKRRQACDPDLHKCVELYSKYIRGEAQPPFLLTQDGTKTEDIAQFIDGNVRPAYDAMKAAQLVFSWTAFETLSGDLWEAAVNCHPQILSQMRFTKGSQTQSKSIPLSYLEKYDYEIKDKMGTILREEERVKFSKLETISEAYRLTFPEECPVHSDDFWQNQDVKAVAALRNVIAHNAGIVDDEFAKKRGPHPDLSHYKCLASLGTGKSSRLG
jgi:hypothetical protein